MKDIRLTMYNTSERLPDDGQWVFWWHPIKRWWQYGAFYTEIRKDYAPGYFNEDCAVWYVCDRHTWWMPEPPSPEMAGK